MKKLLLILGMTTALMLAPLSYASGALNVNTATVEQLQSINGIGAKTAEAIVKHRNEHGKFANIEALTAIKGIGEKKLEKIKPFLTVGEVSKH